MLISGMLRSTLLRSKVNSKISGLPSGQLSFLLRAGADCLPTPLNLSCWKYQVDSKCPLCKSLYPTTSHILNGSHEALVQKVALHGDMIQF